MAESSKPTITGFLLARIAEDEARAGDAFDHWGPGLEYFECDEIFGVAISRSRLLAECTAKRAIIGDPDHRGGVMYYHSMMALASVYADHPDYQQEWAL